MSSEILQMQAEVPMRKSSVYPFSPKIAEMERSGNKPLNTGTASYPVDMQQDEGQNKKEAYPDRINFPFVSS
jgi:hypothetical protein